MSTSCATCTSQRRSALIATFSSARTGVPGSPGSREDQPVAALSHSTGVA